MSIDGKKTSEVKEGVDVPSAEKFKEPRQTVVTKGITRTLKTAEYFSLTISHTAQDTITWYTPEEREKKIQNATKLAIKDFIYTHDAVLDQLKLAQMHAFVKDHIKAQKLNKEIDLEEMDDAAGE